MEKIRILLADDHKILRSGIKAMLSEAENIEVAGECEDGEDVLEYLEQNEHPHVILMDVDMPNLSGIEATEIISKKYPEIRILTITMHHDHVTISKMLKAGALGYILKSSDEDVIVNAITEVAKGNKFFSNDVVEVMMTKYMKNEQPKKVSALVYVDDLTGRETEILKLIARQFTNKEIAEKLFISQRTVDTHRRNLLDKLGVKNTAGLVAFAYEQGLME
ncbi:MAG: response regulator transcription factor [Bacteroidetes bacterium]|nr:response regulator transcription factor [Bacteroidota bacterium]